MQLSPGDYVSDAFRAETNKWMIDFFGYDDDSVIAPIEQVIRYNDANITAPKQEKAKLVKKSHTQVQPDMKTFSALLNGLEDSFHSLKIPTISGSWLAKKDVNAIKKLGVYIPTKEGIVWHKNPTIPPVTSLPMIASALTVHSSNDIAGHFSPRFSFCIKAAKLPSGVEPIKGVPYQFGMCFYINETESGKGMPPKTFWMWCWIVVKSDGAIHIPQELRMLTNRIKHKARGVHGSSTVYNRQWMLPSLAIAEHGRDQDAHEQLMACTFEQLIIWWTKRKEQWSVGVRKNGNRATFSIEKEQTASYFADRDTVVNVDGKPKKIIHFVRQHTRSNGSEVKEHVRGLREFDWKGYQCTVTAPNLNGAIVTDAPLDPVELDKNESMDGYLTNLEAASILANAEDAKC